MSEQKEVKIYWVLVRDNCGIPTTDATRLCLDYEPEVDPDEIFLPVVPKSDFTALQEKLEVKDKEIARLRDALRGIIEIGKRDMSNPKYDSYFEAANKALRGGGSDENTATDHKSRQKNNG